MTASASQTTATRLSVRIAPALAAIIFGVAIFLTTGFAWPSFLHNATHDTRHALGLPCH